VGSLPHLHAVDFYDHEHELVDIIARFVAEGFALGERSIIVATGPHRAGLDAALAGLGHDPDEHRAAGDLVTLDAAATLDTILVDVAGPGFDGSTVSTILTEALADGRPLRVFGEMVALLWDAGHVLAAIELEALWNRLQGEYQFSLLCAYPTSALGAARLGEVSDVCALHTDVHAPASYARRGSPAAVRPGLSEVFLPVPEAVPATRRFVSDVLARWQEDALVPDATVIVSELASNAVLHAHSPFRVSIDRSVGMVCISIQDVAADLARQQPESIEPGGRGMVIVEALSRRWGCDSLPGGKVVWAELSATGTDV